MQASSSLVEFSWFADASPLADDGGEVEVPRSTAAAIGAALATPLVPSTRYRFGAATPQFAGLTSAQDVAARERAAQAAAAARAQRESLAAFTPRMALADMRAAATGMFGGRRRAGEASPLRGLAMWCLVAALLLASMRW